MDKAMRSYRIQTNYHHYAVGKGCHGEVRMWRPHVETGGNDDNTNGLSRPNCNTYCGNMSANFLFERGTSSGKAYSYDAAVKAKSALGLDLSVKRVYNTFQTLAYKFKSDTKLHKLCGNNDYPSMAGKMVDRYR